MSKREFAQRLVLAEVIARRGEGPLAPRFLGLFRREHAALEDESAGHEGSEQS